MRRTVIQNALRYILELNESFREWDADEAFLSNKDRQKIKLLFHKCDSKWTPKMLFDSWLLLKDYKDYLEEHDIKFDEIEKPDYDEDVIDESCNNILLVKDEVFIIEKCCQNFKEAIQDEIISEEKEHISFKIKLKNIYTIFKFFKSNSIQIDRQAMRYINFYLNKINEEHMFKGLEENKNINITLRPFQEIGAMFLLMNKRAILADEMGLGKTVQSLAAIEMANAYPCVIICPSSLKFNWINEASHIINKRIEKLRGKKTKPGADIYIVNYESVHKNIDFIKNLKCKSMIFDESHYLKNPEAKRTKHCLDIINHVEYRFLLTGTAVLNTPIELISQLKVLRRLEEHFENEEYFIEKFCGSQQTQWGKDNNGASNLELLAAKLREGFFLRRLKRDVGKELPDKIKTVLPVEISHKSSYKNKLKEFMALPREEKVAKISDLRQFVAQEKIKYIKNWIDEFLSTNEKLVVFAYHREIQKAIADLYPDSAQVFAEDDIEENVTKFKEDPDCRIILCSLKIGSVGLNLTEASNVLFCEMDWCPAINEQAEDRCHRIGQLDTVNSWYFIAKGTIDEHVWNICERKKDIIEQIYQNPDDKVFLEKMYSSIINEVIDSVEEELFNEDEEEHVA